MEEPNKLSNITETEEGTIALQKKRSRRVSFAEITSVHVFDRDEDFQTPPEDPKPKMDDEVIVFFRDLADGEDSNDLPSYSHGDDDEEITTSTTNSFFLSSSPATPIDADDGDFFGPVSSSFIRPRHSSDNDTAASEDDNENHDFTMDSTAFSMHFRSLSRPESEVDLKTPSAISPDFQRRTPTLNTNSGEIGRFMVLTGDKKCILSSPALVDNSSCSKDSNDMSLVGEKSHRYDYSKLSPTLDALLARDKADSPSSYPTKESVISRVCVNSNSSMDPKDSVDVEIFQHGTHDGPAEAETFAHKELGNANGYSSIPIGDIAHSSDDGLVIDASFLNPAQSPFRLNRENHQFDTSKDSISDACEASRSKTKIYETGAWFKENNIQGLRHNNFIHYDSAQQHQSALIESQSSFTNENQRHEYNPRNELLDFDADQNFGQNHRSELAELESSLPVTQSEAVLDAAKSPRHSMILTPEKWPGSILSQESIRQIKSTSSIQKSISKLNTLSNSPYILSLQVEDDRLRRHSSGSRLISSFSNSKGLQRKHGDVPTANLDKQFLKMDKKAEDIRIIRIDSNGLETPKNLKKFTQTPETTNFSKSEIAGISSLPFTMSGIKMSHDLLVSENFAGEPFVSSGTTSLVDTTSQHGKYKRATDSPEKFISSEMKRLKNLLSSPQNKGNLAKELRKQNESNTPLRGVSVEGDDTEIAPSESLLAAIAQKEDLVFLKRIEHSNSHMNGDNSEKDLAQIDRIGLKEKFHIDLQKEAEATNLQTPSGKIRTLEFQLVNHDENLQAGTEPAMLQMKLRGGKVISSPSRFVSSPVTRKSTIESSLKKSPTRKYNVDVLQCDNVHHSVESSIGRKRRHGELVLSDGDQMEATSMIQHYQNLEKSGINNSMILFKHSNESSDEGMQIGDDISLKDSIEIFSRFSLEVEMLHSPLIDKLNLRAIDALEDILVHLQKVKKTEMLCSDIQSQKILSHISNIRHKRIYERRALLSRIVYERAKLQLLKKSWQRLLKKVDVMKSGTQELQTIRMNYFKDISVTSAKDAQDDDCPCVFVDKQVSIDNVTTQKNQVEVSDREIEHLTEFFHTFLKKKGKLSTAETIVLLNDYLRQRTCCRFICQDLQPWEFDDLQSRNNQHNVVLNYRGLIIQRFTLSVLASRVIVSHELNDANIVKKFPNMDACTAFAFVLKTEKEREYVGGRSFAQETQMTSSLLCNLQDVIEDVCGARVELPNLIDTRFHSPSVERLHLQLNFMDIKSGGKLVLTLDVSCLNCGVYPSDLVQSEMKGYSGAVSGEIIGAMEGLKAGGYTRILSLCRRVSQILDAYSSR